jgi:hypothetical protein
MPAGKTILNAELQLTIKSVQTAVTGYGLFSILRNITDFTVADNSYSGANDLDENNTGWYPVGVGQQTGIIKIVIPTSLIDSWLAGSNYGVTLNKPVFATSYLTLHNFTAVSGKPKLILTYQ